MTEKGALLAELIEKELELVGVYRRSIGSGPNLGTLNALSHTLENLDHALREKMQEETRGAMWAIIEVLERGGEPGPAEKDLIRAWMVGDAEHYVKAEKNFGDWTAELNRLLDRVASARGKTLSPSQLSELQATVRDALRTGADIHFHEEQRERLERFRSATADWSAEDRKFLAGVLRAKLQSHED